MGEGLAWTRRIQWILILCAEFLADVPFANAGDPRADQVKKTPSTSSCLKAYVIVAIYFVYNEMKILKKYEFFLILKTFLDFFGAPVSLFFMDLYRILLSRDVGNGYSSNGCFFPSAPLSSSLLPSFNGHAGYCLQRGWAKIPGRKYPRSYFILFFLYRKLRRPTYELLVRLLLWSMVKLQQVEEWRLNSDQWTPDQLPLVC